MASFNKVILMGNMTRDPQTRTIGSGTTVTEFGLAANRKFKTAGGEQREEVLFVDCTAFGKPGEIIAEHCEKGKSLLVEGRLKYDSWDDKSGGGKRSKLSVVVENFQFVGAKGDGEARAEAPARPAPRRAAKPADEEIPF